MTTQQTASTQTGLGLSTYDQERQDGNLVRLFLLPRDVVIRWWGEFQADRGSVMVWI